MLALIVFSLFSIRGCAVATVAIDVEKKSTEISELI